ncbi:MAG: hypothetical protein Q4B68_08785 [Bacteroidales bacterium]|nr:hypothetical protein [Bacteroidales bacterium]
MQNVVEPRYIASAPGEWNLTMWKTAQKKDPTLSVESHFLWALTDSFLAALRKRLRDNEPGGSNPYNTAQKKTRLYQSSLIFVGVDGFEPPTLCL